MLCRRDWVSAAGRSLRCAGTGTPVRGLKAMEIHSHAGSLPLSHMERTDKEDFYWSRGSAIGSTGANPLVFWNLML